MLPCQTSLVVEEGQQQVLRIQRRDTGEHGLAERTGPTCGASDSLSCKTKPPPMSPNIFESMNTLRRCILFLSHETLAEARDEADGLTELFLDVCFQIRNPLWSRTVGIQIHFLPQLLYISFLLSTLLVRGTTRNRIRRRMTKWKTNESRS